MNLLPRDLRACMGPLAPVSACELYAPVLTEMCNQYGITDTYELSALLGTIRVESDHLRAVSEYRGSEKSYAPYYGRGLIQLTHAAAYRSFGEWAGVDALGQPEVVCEPHNAVLSAIYFWCVYKPQCRAAARAIATDGRAAMDRLSRLVQGSHAPQDSLDSRWACFQACLQVLSTPTVPI